MNFAIDTVGIVNEKKIIIGWVQDENVDIKAYYNDGKVLEDTKVLKFIRKDVNEQLKLDKNSRTGFIVITNLDCNFLKFNNIKVEANQEHDSFQQVLNEYLNYPIEEVKVFVKKLIKNDIQAFIDYFFEIGNNRYFFSGWRYSKDGESVKVVVKDGNFQYFDCSRDDLKNLENIGECYKNAGFYGVVELNKIFNDKIEFIFESNTEILRVKKDIDKKNIPPKEKSQIMLNCIDINKKEFKEIFDKVYGKALQDMWSEYFNNLDLQIEVKSYGEIPKNPQLSIIVPLYGRVDFVEFQNAVFSTDKDFLENVELIYVLDDPERFYPTIDEYLKSRYDIYNVPMKLIKYNYNLGYARANNIGVKYATADKILLLNSDVFPKQKGWVSEIIRKYENLEKPGVLGFKLLYEDETIQHIGMEFKKSEYLSNMFINYHPHKGLPDIDKSEKIEEKEAVTGACMLLEKKNYVKIGGFSENYIIGDFEDSDLCLKLREKGLKIYYSSKPEFYHLERQSQDLFDDKNWKFKITIYNCWQQMNKWSKLIEGER